MKALSIVVLVGAFGGFAGGIQARELVTMPGFQAGQIIVKSHLKIPFHQLENF